MYITYVTHFLFQTHADGQVLVCVHEYVPMLLQKYQTHFVFHCKISPGTDNLQPGMAFNGHIFKLLNIKVSTGNMEFIGLAWPGFGRRLQGWLLGEAAESLFHVQQRQCQQAPGLMCQSEMVVTPL